MVEQKQAKSTLVIFSGELDKQMAAFNIAIGAASMGQEVTLFFTFWGINVLRKETLQLKNKSWFEKLFSLMMPRGPGGAVMSKMNMLGLGTAMMNWRMRQKNVAQLPQLIDLAKDLGVRLVACEMTMHIMGLTRDDLRDGVDYGGVASYIADTEQAHLNLFIS